MHLYLCSDQKKKKCHVQFCKLRTVVVFKDSHSRHKKRATSGPPVSLVGRKWLKMYAGCKLAYTKVVDHVVKDLE